MGKARRLPTWVPTAVVALALFGGVQYAAQVGQISTYWYRVVQLAGIMAVTALGLNLIYGFNGQFSLGHIGFYAIGAYGSALITKDFQSQWSGGQYVALSWMMAAQLGIILLLLITRVARFASWWRKAREALDEFLKPAESTILALVPLVVAIAVVVAVTVLATVLLQKGLDAGLTALLGLLSEQAAQNLLFALALLNGGTMAAVVGYLVGLPLLRLTSDYFGIATLGFAIMIYTALQNSDMVIPIMKGARGMVAIPQWTTWGWVFGVLVVVAVVMRNLVHSSAGRAIISVREDEIAAKAMGIDIAQHKATAFAFGAFFAGLAGGLYAHLMSFLHPSTFNVVKGFDPLIIIVFGGLGSMTGTLVASVGFAMLIEGLRVLLPQGFEDWRFVLYPLMLLVVMLLRQQGLLGTKEWGWFAAPRPEPRKGAVAESAAAEES
jgi:branched-chain amino acid transport system permease protein